MGKIIDKTAFLAQGTKSKALSHAEYDAAMVSMNDIKRTELFLASSSDNTDNLSVFVYVSRYSLNTSGSPGSRAGSNDILHRFHRR